MESFLGEIQIFGFGVIPANWVACNGQFLSIAQNMALFSVLGTTFGGDGRTSFAVPDLRGLTPMGVGQGPGLTLRTWGDTGGTEQVTLTLPQLPQHGHSAKCNAAPGDAYKPDNRYWAQDAGGANDYASVGFLQMAPTILSAVGGGQPHSNLQPYLALNFCICVAGVFPNRP